MTSEIICTVTKDSKKSHNIHFFFFKLTWIWSCSLSVSLLSSYSSWILLLPHALPPACFSFACHSSLISFSLHPKSFFCLHPSPLPSAHSHISKAWSAGILFQRSLLLTLFLSSHSCHELLADAIYRLTAAVVFFDIRGSKALRHRIWVTSRTLPHINNLFFC